MWPWVWQWIFRYLKDMIYKGKNEKLQFSKILALQMILLEWKDKIQTEKIHLQVTHLINDMYQDYFKKSYNSITRKQSTQLEKWSKYLKRHFVIRWGRKNRKARSSYSKTSTLICWAIMSYPQKRMLQKTFWNWLWIYLNIKPCCLRLFCSFNSFGFCLTQLELFKKLI